MNRSTQRDPEPPGCWPVFFFFFFFFFFFLGSPIAETRGWRPPRFSRAGMSPALAFSERSPSVAHAESWRR